MKHKLAPGAAPCGGLLNIIWALARSVALSLLLVTAPSMAHAQVTVSVIASDDTASETPADNGEFLVRSDGVPPNAIKIKYSVSGSAKPGDDYAKLPGEVTLSPGQPQASITVQVPGDDDLFEGDETVTITLREENGDDDDDDDDDTVVVGGSPATVTILDSPHSVTASSSSDASENSGGGGEFQVSLGARNESGAALTVQYSVAGTATPGSDYMPLSGVATIPTGSSSVSVKVIPLDDDVQEADETVQITLTGTSDPGAPVGNPATASLLIRDDDSNGDDDDDDNGDDDDDDGDPEVVVSVVASDETASETSSNSGAFLVRRVSGSSRAFTVNYAVSGSASPGDDYSALSGSVSLGSGQSEASIAVNVPGDDSVFEGDETVTVRLLEDEDDISVSGGGATVTILDSPHSVTASRVSNASENPIGVGQIRASLGARNESGANLTVEYSVAGTATPGSDYQALSGSAVIPTGSSSVSIDVTPLDDDLEETDETVEVTLTGTSDSRAPVGTPASASLTIADDESSDDGGDGGPGGDADSDGDLVPDAVEAADGSDPHDPDSFTDSDGGGTADHIETIIYSSFGIPQTDITDASDDRRDLDGDGLPDRLEIATGSDSEAGDSPTAGGAGDDNDNGISNAVEAYLASVGIVTVDTVSDLDRDGYPDAAEVALGLNPLRASASDADSDGVPDVVETLAGLDIDAATDSDGDGVPDAREIALDADPLDANLPVANGAMDDDDDGVSNAIEHVLQTLGAEGDIDESSDGDGDGISDADEIRFGTDPFHDEQPVPWVELTQEGIGAVNALSTSEGAARATAVVGGPQSAALSYDWSDSDNAILAVTSGGQTDKVLTFSPQTLPAGHYTLVVQVQRTLGDYSSPVSVVEFPLNVLAGADAAAIADADRDGIPDSSDDVDARTGFANELPAQPGSWMQASPGLRLQLGTIARSTQATSARVTHQDIANAGDGNGGSVGNSEDDFDYVSGIYDFEVTNLPEAGSVVRIVIPQATAVAEFPEYRKFQPGSGWADFVEDGNNSVESAAGSAQGCPAPGDDSYASGLTAGHFCVQLSIEDGGPNDGDAALGPNGVIEDPSGVATPKGEVSVGSGSGNTGPAALFVLGIFSLLAALRRRTFRIRKR